MESRTTRSIGKRLVGMIHRIIITTVGCLVLTFFVSLAVLGVVWIYFFSHGAAVPDNSHLFELSDHSRHSYVVHWQRQLLDILQISVATSGIVAFPGLLLGKGYRSLFPPSRWGYEAH